MQLRLADTPTASGAEVVSDAADDTVGFYDNPVYAYAWSIIVSRTSRRSGPVAVIGEPGIGKSLLLQRVMKGLAQGVHPLLLPHPSWELGNLLDQVEGALGPAPTETPAIVDPERRLANCRKRLIEQNHGERWIVLLVDDAHEIPKARLADLLRLVLPEPGGEPILGLVLAGLPELEKQLAAPPFDGLLRDSLHICRLRPLRAGEVETYIQKRCKLTGSWQHHHLSPKALARIGSYSRGIPRLINTLCDAASDAAARHHQERITEEIIEEAAQGCSLALGLDQARNGSPLVHKDRDSAERNTPNDERTGTRKPDVSTEQGVSNAAVEMRQGSLAADVPPPPDVLAAAESRIPDGKRRAAALAASASSANSSSPFIKVNRFSEGERPVDRRESLNKVLKNLQAGSPDVEASALITEDGLIVASALPQDLDETRVAGMSATLLSLGTRAAAELRRGEVQEVIVRGDEGYAVMITAGRGVLLLVVANEHAKLGLIFFDMREAINAIKRIL